VYCVLPVGPDPADPRWGRGQETFGEDPTLTSAITAAIVTGLQFGGDPNYNKMIATSKHWLAYHLYECPCAFVRLTMTCCPPLWLVASYTSPLLRLHNLRTSLASCRDSWGSDKQYRLSHSFNLSDTDIAQYYVKPFAAAIDSNVSAVMCAYDGTNASSPNPLWPHPGGPEPWGVPMYVRRAT
jgi:hypothetical protein